MKASIPLTILAALAMFPALAAAQAEPPMPSVPAGGLVKQAFLGVATNPVDPAMGSQLGLDPGTGLVVAHISEDSPAADSLRDYDVLTKFNDQILVNHEQLAVLVRLAGMGKTVKLELLRKGARQVVDVSLGEREGPADDPRQMVLPSAPGEFPYQVPAPGAFGDFPNQYQRSWQWKWDLGNKKPDPKQLAPKVVPEPKPGKPAKVLRHTWSHNDVVLVYVEEDGRRQLTINEAGKEMFDGPINTREELEKVPKQFLPDVEEMLKDIPR